MAQRNTPSSVSPIALMLGSGLHRSILGEAAHCSPLASWQLLLRRTAEAVEIPAALAEGPSLAMAWERMVLHACSRGFVNRRRNLVRPRELPARRVDVALRTVCRDILARQSSGREGHYLNHPWILELRRLIRRRPTYVVDFNFDTLVADAIGVDRDSAPPPRIAATRRPAKLPELTPLLTAWKLEGAPKSLYWQPHGWIGRPAGMRLGLRDFGLQASAYRWAFEHGKGLERRSKSGSKQSPRVERLANSWVWNAFRYECRVVGLGVGPDEWGLQWLFVQRARNAVRHDSMPRTVKYEKGPPYPLSCDLSLHESWRGALAAAVDG